MLFARLLAEVVLGKACCKLLLLSTYANDPKSPLVGAYVSAPRLSKSCRSGAISDALCIDEGFGTLDAES
jgi:hypothetical protein